MWIKQYQVFYLLSLIITCSGLSGSNEYEYTPEHETKDYSFSYGVKDVSTGDVKTQWEKKDGGTVRGHYSLLEADGSTRIVEYTADEKTGFHATVKHKGPSYHPISKFPKSHKEVTIKAVEPSESNVYVHKEKFAEHPNHQYHKQTFVFVPQEEYQSDEIATLSSNNAEDSAHIHKYVYTKIPETHDSNTNFKSLPIDLSLIKPELKTKQLPLQIDLVDPHVIDLGEISASRGNTNGKEQQVITLESLEDENNEEVEEEQEDIPIPTKNHKYNTPNKNLFHEPHIETGFKPIKNYAQPIAIHPIPNTFQTNKKPTTTPGLMTYASQNVKYNGYSSKNRYELPQYRGPKAGPILFPKNRERSIPTKHLRSAPRVHGNNGFVKYAKRITIQ